MGVMRGALRLRRLIEGMDALRVVLRIGVQTGRTVGQNILWTDILLLVGFGFLLLFLDHV